MRKIEKLCLNVPIIGDLIKANAIAESFNIKTYSNWYLVLGSMGFSPVILVYRKMYREGIIMALISFILSPVAGFGAASKIFNVLMTMITMIMLQVHIKRTILSAVGRTTDEKIFCIKNALDTDKVGAIIATIIYVGVLTFIGYSGYFIKN